MRRIICTAATHCAKFCTEMCNCTSDLNYINSEVDQCYDIDYRNWSSENLKDQGILLHVNIQFLQKSDSS